MKRLLVVSSVVIGLALSGCGQTGFVDPSTVSDGVYSTAILTETSELIGLGHEIDHPAGWEFTQIGEPPGFVKGVIAEKAEDLPVPDDGDESVVWPTGVVIRFDQLPGSDLAEFGYDATTGLNGFYEFNAGLIGLPEPRDREQIDVGTGMAISAVYENPGEHDRAFVMGQIDDRFFLIGLDVPLDSEIDDFLPVWEAMISSIRPLGSGS